MDNKLVQLVLSRFIPSKTNGYMYLSEMTDMYIKQRNGEVKYLWNNKIQIIADKYDTTYGAITRGCSYLISKAWEQNNADLRKTIFRDMPYKPSFTEFCETIADFVRNNEKELTDNTFEWEIQNEE